MSTRKEQEQKLREQIELSVAKERSREKEIIAKTKVLSDELAKIINDTNKAKKDLKEEKAKLDSTMAYRNKVYLEGVLIRAESEKLNADMEKNKARILSESLQSSESLKKERAEMVKAINKLREQARVDTDKAEKVIKESEESMSKLSDKTVMVEAKMVELKKKEDEMSVKSAEITKLKDELKAYEDKHKEILKDISRREEKVNLRESVLGLKESAFDKREKEYAGKIEILKDRELEIDMREVSVERKERRVEHLIKMNKLKDIL